MSSIYEQIYRQIDSQWFVEFEKWQEAIIRRFGESIYGDEEGNVYDANGELIAAGFEPFELD